MNQQPTNATVIRYHACPVCRAQRGEQCTAVAGRRVRRRPDGNFSTHVERKLHRA